MAKIPGQLEDAQLHNKTSDPAVLPTGKIWIRTDTNDVKVYDGAATRTLVSKDATQTLTNKTLSGNTAATLINGSGTVAVNSSGTVTLPNATDTLVGKATTDTLTNKTVVVASNTITTAASGNLAATELNAALSELQSDIDTRATSSALTTHIANTATHGVTTVAGISEAQVFTNKDIDGGTAANTRRITLPKNTKANLDALTRKEGTLVYGTDTAKPYYDNGSVLKLIGSGSGSSINYILNPDAETDTVGWATYADAAGTSPVDGTGGSPTTTWTRSTSSPLRTDANFLLTKPASNVQGEGASYAFTVDRADLGKILQISFDYEVGSGTYATGDVRVYIYDVTNAAVIEPSNVQVANAVGSVPHRATFQTLTTSSSYRLILHVASTSASAYTLKVDNVIVGPQVQVNGAYLGDMSTSAAITVGAVTTPPTKGTLTKDSVVWRREGQYAFITYNYYQSAAGSGAAGSGDYLFSLPAGLVVDTTNLTVSTGTITINTNTAIEGRLDGVFSYAGTSGTISGSALLYSTTQFRVYGHRWESAGANAVIGSTFGQFSNAVNHLSGWIKVPILGWGSNVTYASDAGDGREVSASYYISANFAASATTPINFDTKDYDSHSAVTTSATAWKFTAPIAGTYEIKGAIVSSTGTVTHKVFKNGVAYKMVGYSVGTATNGVSLSGSIKLLAGDYIDIRPHTASTISGGATQDTNATGNITIVRVSGPSAISAAETVAASASTTAGQSIAATTTSTVVFGTSSFDTHGALNLTTGIFTAPIAGKYKVIASLRFASGAWTAANVWTVDLYKNGSLYRSLVARRVDNAGTYLWGNLNGETTVSLLSGETIDVRIRNPEGTARTLTTTAGENYIDIIRLGN